MWSPTARLPHRLQTRLRLRRKDYGVDGIIETTEGQYHGYQVKFRSNRDQGLTWDDLSTFFGLSDRCEGRLVFTNTNDVAPVAKERTGFYAIRASDLDRLREGDLQAIYKWLKGASFTLPRKTPRSYQQRAVDDIVGSLKRHDRTTALMACGTGKTLVALWAAEAMRVKNVLVLVPSLALVRQTLHEWLRETGWEKTSYICVCSDPTVTEDTDSMVMRESDLDFTVSTDPTEVRRFLDHATGTRLVFTTYQSASVVGEALKSREKFDLAIFDEAHKTAGRVGARFGFALSDSNIPARKRLFLTATPRHHNPVKRDAEGDPTVVFSMDQPDVYGPIAHKLSFAVAAKKGIICPYKVVISVVTSQMVTNTLPSGEVLLDGDTVKARQVASQIALRQATRRHSITKIFTFHSTVASARSFAAKGPEGAARHLRGFECRHVSGKMRTALRDALMHEFEHSDRALMTNARCLTEGVDVPTVDMVAFLSPKRSRVDIEWRLDTPSKAVPPARYRASGGWR